MGPSVIDENASHHFCCDAKKLCPVLPAHAVLLGELQEELIYQGRRLYGVFAALTAQVIGGDLV